MSERLPQGWCVAEFIDLISLSPNSLRRGPFGSAIKKAYFVPNGFKVYEQKNAIYNDITLGTYFISKEKYEELIGFSVEPGDFIVSCAGTIGRISQLPNDAPAGVINQALMKITLNPGVVDSKFFFLFFKNPDFQERILKRTRGSAMKNMSSVNDIKELPIELPPLPEQKRIADKLDCLLAKVDACKERLDKVPEIIKRFRQSVLADAVSGKLTEDWTDKKKYYSKAEKSEKSLFDIPNNWEWSKIEKIANVKGGKRLPKGKKLVEHNTGFPYIRAGQLKNGTVNCNDQKFLKPETQKKIQRYIVNSGDVYITIVGACIGDSGIIPDDYHRANLTENAAKLCDHKNIINKYLSFWLRSPKGQDYIKFLIKSGAQGKLALKRIKNIPLPVPSEEEQNEIIRRVEALFTVADQIEEKLTIGIGHVNKLTASILSKAFRGELVPQDPNDEPAEALLKRIRAEREVLAANKKKGGRAPKKRSGRGEKTKLQKADAEVEPEPEAAEQLETVVNKEKDKVVKPKKPAAIQSEKRFERTDVLKAFRKAIFHQNDLAEPTLLRLVGQRLGVQRLSKPIRQELEFCILTAIRRNIIARNGDGFNPATQTIHHYEEDYLIKVLKSLIRKGYEYQRGHVVENLAVYLGYDKVSDAFAQRMKTIFRLAIRRGELYRNGAYVGKF